MNPIRYSLRAETKWYPPRGNKSFPSPVGNKVIVTEVATVVQFRLRKGEKIAMSSRDKTTRRWFKGGVPIIDAPR